MNWKLDNEIIWCTVTHQCILDKQLRLALILVRDCSFVPGTRLLLLSSKNCHAVVIKHIHMLYSQFQHHRHPSMSWLKTWIDWTGAQRMYHLGSSKPKWLVRPCCHICALVHPVTGLSLSLSLVLVIMRNIRPQDIAKFVLAVLGVGYSSCAFMRFFARGMVWCDVMWCEVNLWDKQ